MDYAEHPLPPSLDGLVAAVWTAQLPADGPEWVALEAVPDGCVELIRRTGGRSIWRREQPALFATGLASTTAKLRLGAGACFLGIKLWPWAWHALGGARCADFADDWIEASAFAALIEGDAAAVIDRLAATFAAIERPPLARAVPGAGSVAEIAGRAGLSHRQLQRVFARDTGMPPRSYLRLLRFRQALAEVQARAETLADTAAARGYADQAHMAREFRTLAGLPPSAARARAKGPFV